MNGQTTPKLLQAIMDELDDDLRSHIGDHLYDCDTAMLVLLVQLCRNTLDVDE